MARLDGKAGVESQKNGGHEKTFSPLSSLSLSLVATLVSLCCCCCLFFLSPILLTSSFSFTLIHEVTRDEQREERRQRSVDQTRFLPSGQAVGPQAVPLVLFEACDLAVPGAERELSGAADGAAPVGWEVLEGGSGGDGVLGVL